MANMKEYTLHDSIYIKLKTRQNESMILEDRIVVTLGERWGRSMGEGSIRGFWDGGCLSLFRLLY